MTNSTYSAKLGKTTTPKIQTITLGGHQSTTVCPPPMLGDHPGSTSPHHLFLASIGSCINLIFEVALEKARVEIFDLDSEIIGHYVTDDDTATSRFESIEVITNVTLPKGTNEHKIERLFEVAHKNCPIGNCLVGSCVKLVTDLKIKFK